MEYAAIIEANSVEVGECVEWQGRMGSAGCAGQPIIKDRIDGKTVNVSVIREVWKLRNGPIPEGKLVYRTCCNDRCIGCLALGVRGDVMRHRRRMWLAKHTPSTRAALTRGARSRANVKNTAEQARAVRELAAVGVPDILISGATDVGIAMVADIRRGRAWAEQSHAASVFSWRPA
jgi:hypothetical protein